MALREPTLQEQLDADAEQWGIWYNAIFKGTTYNFEDVLDVLQEYQRPVIRFIDVWWNRQRGYWRAEVNNYYTTSAWDKKHGRNFKAMHGRQGFGYGDDPVEALMQAACDWYWHIQHMKQER